MAVHTYTTRTVVHHEWTLDAPAHYSDVDKAVNVAKIKQGAITDSRVGDIYITHRDETIVIFFTEERRGA